MLARWTVRGRRLYRLLLVVAGLNWAAAQTLDVRAFAFGRPIVLTSETPIHLVELPFDLYAATTDPALADVRVVDADDNVVPFAIFDDLRQNNWTGGDDRAWFWAQPIAGQPTQDDRVRDYWFDVGSSPPTDRVRFTLPQPNTAAPAALYSSATPEGPWTLRYQGLLYRLRRNGELMTSLPSPVALSHDRYWRLRVDVRDGGLGEGDVTLELRHRPELLAFIATGTPPYRLLYGHPDAPSAAIDLDTLLGLLPPDAPLGLLPDAVLGDTYAIGTSVQTTSLRWRWLVLSVLIALTLFAALRSWRRSRSRRTRSVQGRL